MGFHPIGLEAAAGVQSARFVFHPNRHRLHPPHRIMSQERRAVLEAVPLHEVPLRLQGEYFSPGEREDS